MNTYRVFFDRRETIEVLVDANSPEEAEELADNSFTDFDQLVVDGSITTELLPGETQLVSPQYTFKKYRYFI